MDEEGVVTRQHCTNAMPDHLHRHKGQLWPEQEKHLRAEAMRENKKYRDSSRPENDSYVGALRLRYA